MAGIYAFLDGGGSSDDPTAESESELRSQPNKSDRRLPRTDRGHRDNAPPRNRSRGSDVESPREHRDSAPPRSRASGNAEEPHNRRGNAPPREEPRDRNRARGNAEDPRSHRDHHREHAPPREEPRDRRENAPRNRARGNDAEPLRNRRGNAPSRNRAQGAPKDVAPPPKQERASKPRQSAQPFTRVYKEVCVCVCVTWLVHFKTVCRCPYI